MRTPSPPGNHPTFKRSLKDMFARAAHFRAQVERLRGIWSSLSRFDVLLILMICSGVIIHIAAVWFGRVLWDGATYAYMGGSYSHNHAFLLDWQADLTFPQWEFGFLYSLYLASFYAVFGFGLAVTKLAVVLSSLATIGVAYWTTRDLFDRTKGLIVGALVALDVTLVRTTYLAYSEPFALTFAILAFWALVRSMKDSRYAIAFGLFMGLFYFSRSVIGWSYIAIALSGLVAWRWYHVRGRLLRDWYWVGGLLLVVPFVVVREVLIEGAGRTYQTHALGYGFDQPGLFLSMMAFKLVFLFLVLATFCAFWLPELRTAVLRRREPLPGLLLLCIAGLAGAILLITTVIGITEPYNPIFWQDHTRYTVLLLAPILWLVFLHTSFKPEVGDVSWRPSLSRPFIVRFLVVAGIAVATFVVIGLWLAIFIGFAALASLYQSPRKRLVIMLVAFLISGANAATLVDRPAFVDATIALNERLRAGDVIEIDRRVPPLVNGVHLYSYLTVREVHIVPYDSSLNGTFILSQTAIGANLTYPGYTLVGVYVSSSQRTILARVFGALVGSSEPIEPHQVAVWQFNATIGR